MNGKWKFLTVALAASVALGGCATRYSVERTFTDGSSIKATATSFRDIEQPKLHYSRTDDEITFDFQAQTVDNNTDVTAGAAVNLAAPFMGMAAGVLDMVLKGQLVPAGTVTPPPAPGN